MGWGWRNQHLFPVTFIDTGSNGFNPTSRRSWVTDLTAIKAKGVACAALAAFPVVVFFYLDQPLGTGRERAELVQPRRAITAIRC